MIGNIFTGILECHAKARFQKGYEVGQRIDIEEAEREIQTARDFGDYDEFDKGLEKAINERKERKSK